MNTIDLMNDGELIQRIAQRDGVKRAVADYVAGMTDRYALDTYASIFIPSGWSHL